MSRATIRALDSRQTMGQLAIQLLNRCIRMFAKMSLHSQINKPQTQTHKVCKYKATSPLSPITLNLLTWFISSQGRELHHDSADSSSCEYRSLRQQQQRCPGSAVFTAKRIMGQLSGGSVSQETHRTSVRVSACHDYFTSMNVLFCL